MSNKETKNTDNVPESEHHYRTTIRDQDIHWKLYLAPKPSTARQSPTDAQEYFTTLNRINMLALTRPDMGGTCIEHDQTLSFLTNRWSEILDVINSERYFHEAPIFAPVAFPEIKLTYPIFDGSAGHSLDFIGFDEIGDIYVIEVGRGHKSDQLERQLYLARHVFPQHRVHGLIAKYTPKSSETFRLYFRYH